MIFRKKDGRLLLDLCFQEHWKKGAKSDDLAEGINRQRYRQCYKQTQHLKNRKLIFENINIDDDPTAIEFFDDFSQLMNNAEFPSKHILHQEGEICDKLFIIHQGLVRAFYYKDGKDITAHFAIENTSITAIDSFIQNKKSKYTIEVLENTNLSWVTHKEWYELLSNKPHYEKYARLFLENIYIDIAERIEDLLFYTAKERYEKIAIKFPSLLQRVNLGHIASYIGITQETLSRIRAENK